MDSITTAIVTWLNGCSFIAEIAELNVERLTDDLQNLALIRNGTINLDAEYITDKGWHKQFQYILLLKSTSETNGQRTINMDLVDDLISWIQEQEVTQNYPVIAGKQVTAINCSGAVTSSVNDDGTIADYMLQIDFNIKEI